jgi:hypothetical protein
MHREMTFVKWIGKLTKTAYKTFVFRLFLPKSYPLTDNSAKLSGKALQRHNEEGSGWSYYLATN